MSPSNLDDLPAFGDGDFTSARHDPLEWIEADKGVAAHLLATLYRLEQKALLLRPRCAQEAGDRRFQVGRQRATDGNERVFFGEREKLLAAGLDEIGRSFHRHQCNCWRELPLRASTPLIRKSPAYPGPVR